MTKGEAGMITRGARMTEKEKARDNSKEVKDGQAYENL